MKKVKSISAGGLISRNFQDRLELLLITTLDGKLTIPKGHIIGTETFEETAVREIKEEIGLKEAAVTGSLGDITRDGMEPSGESSLKEIHFFLMKGSGYTYLHEEDYVWIEFDRALKLMQWKEEKELIEENKKKIAKNVSDYFSKSDLSLLWDNQYANYQKRDEFALKPYNIIEETLSKLTPSATIFELGTATGRDALTFAKAKKSKIFGIDISLHAICKMCENFMSFELDHLLTTKVMDAGNIIESDLPKKIDIFFARFALNLSDMKTFFLINEIIKKMPIGGYVIIEGKTKQDYGILEGKKLGPNVYRDKHGFNIRTWDESYVNEYFVKKLKLKLVKYKKASFLWGQNRANVAYFVLQKTREYCY
ncbi:MAG: NUDIX domain-containing protein [Patescibacteria group bacterium]